MKAKLLVDERHTFSDGVSFAEIVVWQLPQPVSGSTHQFKYSLAYVVEGVCALRYDNERGKGDHMHYGISESAYQFRGIDVLLSDFQRDIKRWNHENRNPGN